MYLLLYYLFFFQLKHVVLKLDIRIILYLYVSYSSYLFFIQPKQSIYLCWGWIMKILTFYFLTLRIVRSTYEECLSYSSFFLFFSFFIHRDCSGGYLCLVPYYLFLLLRLSRLVLIGGVNKEVRYIYYSYLNYP